VVEAVPDAGLGQDRAQADSPVVDLDLLQRALHVQDALTDGLALADRSLDSVVAGELLEFLDFVGGLLEAPVRRHPDLLGFGQGLVAGLDRRLHGAPLGADIRLVAAQQLADEAVVFELLGAHPLVVASSAMMAVAQRQRVTVRSEIDLGPSPVGLRARRVEERS